MSSPSARAPARGRAIRLTPQTWLAVCCAVVAIALVVVQVAHLRSLLDPNQVFTAGFARGLVLGFVLAVGGIGAWTAFAPDRLIRVPLYVAAGIAGLALVATLGVGGKVWSFAVALLTLTASWQLGAWGVAQEERLPARRGGDGARGADVRAGERLDGGSRGHVRRVVREGVAAA